MLLALGVPLLAPLPLLLPVGVLEPEVVNAGLVAFTVTPATAVVAPGTKVVEAKLHCDMILSMSCGFCHLVSYFSVSLVDRDGSCVPLPSVVLPFCEIQAAHKAATLRTLKLVLLQMHCASTTSSDSSSAAASLPSSARCRSLRRFVSESGLTSHVLVRVTMGPHMALHALGTSPALSSSA